VKLHQPPSMTSNKSALPKLLYVGGFGRSGSTLVGRVLGEAPDTICVGETRYLWDRGLRHDVQCGCGQPFRSCPFWSAVGDMAFGGWNQVDTDRLVESDHIINRLRALPLHWLPSIRPRFTAAINDYASWLTRLYIAIAYVSGAKTVVETSKEPNFASLLTQIPGNDVRIIHLVRDSRAVAYSWTRQKRLPSPIGDQQFMQRFGPGEAATRWLIANTAFHALSSRPSPYMRISYESFVTDTRAVLEEISSFAAEQLVPPSTDLVSGRVKLGGHHIFSGNPMRAASGWLEMGLDDAWQAVLPSAQFAEVTAMTWPLLCFYGYPLIPAGRRGRRHSVEGP
jgi:sulfotransferase family protein